MHHQRSLTFFLAVVLALAQACHLSGVPVIGALPGCTCTSKQVVRTVPASISGSPFIVRSIPYTSQNFINADVSVPLSTSPQVSCVNPNFNSQSLTIIPSTSTNHLTFDSDYHSTGGEQIITNNEYTPDYHCPHTPRCRTRCTLTPHCRTHCVHVPRCTTCCTHTPRCRSSCCPHHPLPYHSYHPYYPYRPHIQNCPHMCSDFAHLRADMSGVRSTASRIYNDVNAILRLRRLGATSDDIYALRNDLVSAVRSELKGSNNYNEPKPSYVTPYVPVEKPYVPVEKPYVPVEKPYVPVEKPYVPQYVPEKPYVPQYNKPTVPQQYARVPEDEKPKYHQKRENMQNAFFAV